MKEIFNTTLATSSLEHHINFAASIVDDIEETADNNEPDRTFEQIEQYLSAHVASTQDPRVSDSSVGDSSFTYKGPTETTQYWEIANALDPTGTLGEDTVQVGVDVIDSR